MAENDKKWQNPTPTGQPQPKPAAENEAELDEADLDAISGGLTSVMPSQVTGGLRGGRPLPPKK